jgi:cell division protein FtsN
MPVFDGSIDEDDAEEGSRLPLLIVIAVLVLFAFAGVVYYAYTEGVERGRADAPRVIVAQSSGTKLKVYQQQAPAEDESTEADSVPAPPTPVTGGANPQVSPGVSAAQTQKPEAAPKQSTEIAAEPSKPAPAPVAAPPVPAPTPKPVQKKVTVSAAVPEPPRVATHAPAPLVAPTVTENSSAAPSAPSATPEVESKAAAGGGPLLQIGAYKSQAEAESAWHAFQSKHPIVGGYQSDVKQADLGEKGTWYRLRIGPFPDKDTAVQLCTKLKADGASCLLAK